MNPLEARWAKEPVLTIDGGLATEMEAKGVNIDVSTVSINQALCIVMDV